MSLLIPSIEIIVAGIALVIAIMAGLGVIISKRSFYSIIWLSVVGLAVSIIMAILGFTYLAVFHLIMYIGATIVFLLFVMAAIGEERESSIRHSITALITSFFIALILTFPIFTTMLTGIKPLEPIPWSLIAEKLFSTYWLAGIVILVALASILVEVIAVARKR